MKIIEQSHEIIDRNQNPLKFFDPINIEIIKPIESKRHLNGKKRNYILAKCPYCKKEFKMLKQNVNNYKSCGCKSQFFKDIFKLRHALHSKLKKENKRLYQIWADMKNRCNNFKNSRYHRYGDRGISVCKEWHSFINFYQWAIKNDYDDTLTIDRINNNQNYSSDNCRFVTIQENIKNRPSFKPKKRLKKEQVLKIREMAKDGISRIKIAKMFNLCPETITSIKNRRSWRNI